MSKENSRKRKLPEDGKDLPKKRNIKKIKEESLPPDDLDTSSFHFEVEKTAHSTKNKAGPSCFSEADTIQDHIWLAEVENVDPQISRNIIKLFDEDNTIPFIARYRRDKTGGLTPDRLRALKDAYDSLKVLRSKAENALSTLRKQGEVDPELSVRIKSAKNLEELDLLMAPFKKESKGSLAARAKQAGLEEAGRHLLLGTMIVNIRSLITENVPGREGYKSICSGLQHIVADIIAKDSEVLSHLQTLKKSERIFLECSFKKGDISDADKAKYDLYKNFNQDLRSIRSHQVLAINRAESQKVLSVKVNIPNSFWNNLKDFCRRRWLKSGEQYMDRNIFFEDAMTDCFQRLLSPLLSRQIRRNLTEDAERQSVGVFATNLKNLLLTAPLRGKIVMAIDPGVKHGCKIAIVSPHGQVLHVDKIFISDHQGRLRAADRLADLLRAHQCKTVAIGNGTFCRQTEEFLGKLIQDGRFRPLDVSYTIIDEQGVSIYSCSPAANVEFPAMDPNLISAVSLARRLQDPLAELVKVEPKHLGVGMYQHDVSEKKLSSSLDEVVSECVSFVGVDLNTASLDLLRRVAGLTKIRAEEIASWRMQNGSFINRQQLNTVKGIGSKTFQQCAGFVRILPSTAKQGVKEEVPQPKKRKTAKKTDDLCINPFDMTEIHPEDYDLAEALILEAGVKKNEIGQRNFIDEMGRFIKYTSFDDLGRKHGASVAKVKQVLDALGKEVDHDMRSLSQTPLFRRNITSIDTLTPGSTLSGVIRNVTDFGAFVDIGVGHSGLIHSSTLPRNRDLWVKLGDTVQVQVINVNVTAKRIALRLVT